MAYSPPQRYRTPIGASVMLPPEVASGIVGLEPDAPPAPDLGALVDTPTVPTPPPVDQGLLASPPVLEAPEDPTLGGTLADIARPGIVRPGIVQQMPQATGPGPTPGDVVADVARPGFVRDMPGATGPAQPPPPAPTPAPPPVTADDIRKGGYAPVLDQQREASALKRAAGVEQIAVDKRAAEEEARALAASGERDVQREAERARIQQETLADIARRSAAIDSEIDRIASVKIDASIRSPVLSGIAIAMGAIGAAMAGKTDGSNPALDMILKQRDANVQRQLAEKDAAVRTVGLRRDQLASIRQRLTDSNALFDGLAAAETRRIRNELARVAASTKSESGRANLMKLDAELATEEATHLDAAKTKQFAQDDREKQRKEQERANRVGESQRWAGIAEQRAGRAEQTRQFDAELAFKRQQLDENLKLAREKEANDLQVAVAKGKGDKLVEASKLVAERGIRDPATGDVLVNAQGRKLLDEAAKLEGQAEKLRASTNPAGKAQAEKFAERAAELRAEAQTAHAVLGRNAERADNIGKALADTQTALGLIDTIKADARKAGTQVLNANELEARLGTNIEILGLQLKDAWKLGALDDGTVSYLNRLTGGDPTKLTTKGVMGALGIGEESGEKTITKLDAVAKALEAARYNDLRQIGASGFRFKRDDEADRPEFKAATKLLDAKTPVERGEAARKVGTLRGVVDATEKLLEGSDATPSEKRAREIELATTSKKYPGLAQEQEGAMDELLVQARGDGPEAANARAKLIEAAASTATTRPALSNAVLNVLRDQQPGLYREAVVALPEEERKIREGIERGGREGESLETLEDRAVRGAADAIQELQRRAGADRGGPASKAWMRVLGEFDRRQRAPGGR